MGEQRMSTHLSRRSGEVSCDWTARTGRRRANHRRASKRVMATLSKPPSDDQALPQGAEVLIAVRSVNKWYGQNQILRNVTLDVRDGEVVVICGPSGSGKSTLLRCINRLELIDSGEVWIGGRPMHARSADVNALRREVGFVFQAFNLFPHLSVLDNITLGPTVLRKATRERAVETAMGLLARVGMPDKAHAYPGQLSGGQQQRVAIARALALEPRAMLFDEPTSALDPEMILEVLEVMRGLAQEGMTMVIVTHEMQFAREVAGRMAFMCDGALVEEARPAELCERPREERTRQFMSKVLKH